MKDFVYTCWRVLKLILAATSLCIAILSVVSWSDTGRLEMLLFCAIGLTGSIFLTTSKL